MSAAPTGLTIGVFGSEGESRSALESAVAKKSEAEGIIVYHRTEAGRRFSLLDTGDYPERIQGYARIASISDHAYYMFPKSGRLTAPDGELAVLLEAFGLAGTIHILDGASTPEDVTTALRGTALAGYWVEERSIASSALETSRVEPRSDFPNSQTLVYIDRAFSVKGVGTVALGFVLCGTVSVHDQLRPVPGRNSARADVKGIQINDQDFESAGRGIRIGLSLRGVDPKELEKSHWLDDGSFALTDKVTFQFDRSSFYRQEVKGRDLHIQLPGEMLPARVTEGSGGLFAAALPVQAPVWEGMRVAVADLNAKSLRVAGGGSCKF
jgi:selenocysteine-specific translation elongation factor